MNKNIQKLMNKNIQICAKIRKNSARRSFLTHNLLAKFQIVKRTIWYMIQNVIKENVYIPLLFGCKTKYEIKKGGLT